MAEHAQGASARPIPSPHQIATALIGTRLIAYRVNRRPDQLSYLLGLVRMAAELDAISVAEHKQFLADLDQLLAEEARHD